MKVTNAQELTKRIEQLREAQKQFATFSISFDTFV